MTKNKYTNSYFEGKEAFQIGRKFYNEYVWNKTISPERQKQKLITSLEFFDTAIEKGYDEAELYSFRGTCLRALNYDIDSLDDFNKCIEKNHDRAEDYPNIASYMIK